MTASEMRMREWSSGVCSSGLFEVGEVAGPWWPGAGREGAVPVAGGDGRSLSWGPGLGGVVGVEDVALAVEEDGDHGRVAQQPFGGFLGESPAITTPHELIEVVDVAQPGQGAPVDSTDARRGGQACVSTFSARW